MNWTEEQYQEHMMKFEKWKKDICEIPDEELESSLQSKCLRYCKEHGYPAFHDRSRKKNLRGWPDMIVFLPGGKVKLFELKSKNGRFRKEQLELRKVLHYLGHTVNLVRSYKTFLMVINDGK